MSELAATQTEQTQPESETLDQVDALLFGDEDITPEKEDGGQPDERELENANDSEDDDVSASGSEGDVDDSESISIDDDEDGDDSELDADSTVDYDQLIPMPDGAEPMKLGEMKDMVSSMDRTRVQIMERENTVVNRERELSQALALVGGEIPPDIRQAMESRQQEHLQREYTQMLEAIPEWKDPTVFTTDREAIAKTGNEYGFSPVEVAAISDSRVVKLLRDFSKLKGKYMAAEKLPAQLKKKRVPKGQRTKIKTKQSNLDKQVSKAITSRNDDVKFAAIDELLRG